MIIHTSRMYHRLRDANVGLTDDQAWALASATGQVFHYPDADQEEIRQMFCDVGFTNELAAALASVFIDVGIGWHEHGEWPRWNPENDAAE